jgi:chromosome segregation ATPase
MAVVFKTFDIIEIDGIPAGNIVDVISNHGPRRAEVLAAFGVFVERLKVELAEERDKALADLSQMTTERDTALSEKASLQTHLDSANATIETLQATNAELTADLQTASTQLEATTNQLAAANAEIDKLTAVAEQPVATLSQIRVWLLQTLGVNAIKQVDAMIAAIPDELERAIAHQQWEYANNVLRDNPFVQLIAQQLNLTSEQMDEAYLAATRIV